MSRRLAIILAFAALSFIWGSTWIAIKIGLDYWPPFPYAATRSLLASSSVFALMLASGRPLPRNWQQWWPPLGYGAVNGMGMGLVFFGEQYIPAGRAAVLAATVPLFALVVGRLWLRTAITWRKGLAALLGLGGVLVAFSDRLSGAGVSASSTLVFWGQVISLLAALFYGASNVYAKRYHGSIDLLHLVAISQLGAGVAQGLLGLTGPAPTAQVFAWPAVGSLLYLAIVGSAAAYVLLFFLLANVSALQATFVTLLNPIVAVALGAVMLGEAFTALAGAGLALVLFSVWLVSQPERAEAASKKSNTRVG